MPLVSRSANHRRREGGNGSGFDDLEFLRGGDGFGGEALGFEFEAAVEDSDAHHREEVVCCVGVVVDAPEEGGRCVFA